MAQPTKTATEIITAFEGQVSDITELSTTEELALLNRIYQKICLDRPWEFLKTPAAGTVLTDATGSYITVPADFAYFALNNQYPEYSGGVMFIVSGTSYSPTQIIPFSDRRSFVSRGGYAYFDAASNIIRFTGTPSTGTYEFDYIKVPPVLAAGDTPIFPGRFHDMLVFAMSVDNDIIQLSPKAKSYAPENQAKYDSYFDDLKYWDSQLKSF